MSATEVVLYGRPDCHLCEEARELLAELIASRPQLQLREVDIERDEELLRRYLERIPVIEVAGRVVCELVPDPTAISAALLNTSEQR